MEISIRKGKIGDRQRAINVIDTAFGNIGEEAVSFESTHPYLFTDKRIGEYFVAEAESKIIGVLGAYRTDIVKNGVTFKACGVGQVACLPAYRGQGVMSKLMEAAILDMKKSAIDISYLWGEHFRYGNFAYVDGGEVKNFSFWRKHILELDEKDEVVPVCTEDLDLIYNLLKEKSCYLELEKEEVLSIIKASLIKGYRLNDSFIFFIDDETEVVEALGDSKDVLKGLSYVLLKKRAVDGETYKVDIECGSDCFPLNAILAEYYWLSSSKCSANFRIVSFKNFLEKFLEASKEMIPMMNCSFQLGNKETGEAFDIGIDGEAIKVNSIDKKGVPMFSEKELGEIFFGVLPIDLFLNDLPKNSPFRAILPFKLHISKFYSL